MPAAVSIATDESTDASKPAPPRISALDHLLARLPAEVSSSFSAAQLSALEAAVVAPKADHLIDYRISVRWLRRRYYVRLFVGHERRSLSRLQRENQINLAPSLALIAAVIWLMVSAALILALALVYVVKSAFGFDFLDGESFLHACFLG